MDAFDYAKKPISWIDYLINNPKIRFQSSKEETASLSLILLDLTLYKNDELVNMSFELIH